MSEHIEYYRDIHQGTDEWLELRMGKLTASEIKKIITPKKLTLSTEPDAKAHYDEILAQRTDPTPRYNHMMDDMIRGHDDEPYAIEAYEKAYGQKVERCGFITNTEFGGTVGYSPDGLIGDDGLLEAKSRSPKLQTKAILDHIIGRSKELIPEADIIQCQAGLLISGRKWLDYLSFCNGHHMVCIRVYHDYQVQDAIKDAIATFEKTLAKNMKKYLAAIDGDPRLTATVRRKIDEGMI